MLKRILRNSACLVAPNYAPQLYKHLWLAREASLLRKRCDRLVSPEDIVEEVFRCPVFPATQKKTEILDLLKLLKERNPKYLCEIGGSGGGTLFLLCRVADSKARILSVDIAYTSLQLWAFRYFAARGQKVTCLKADSHAATTVDRVKRWLGQQKLDFLFIDGDHSLAGVSDDYSMYAPFVKPDGLIAFHDIVSDFRTRYGMATASDVGEVPEFWRNLKLEGKKTTEIIEDPAQDGFGIGVVFPKGERTLHGRVLQTT